MDMITLGKMEQVKDLRSVWSHEALSFTPWLKDNLDMLSKAVGIEFDYEHVERESDVGDFSVDLYTQEAYEGGRRIIIENQLEKSNHDHLGKIITYASGKDAGIVIWIVSEAREEHRQAVEWLNQHTDDGCAFFLLEIELWKVDGSNPAPKFNVVERPNDWARQMRKANLSEAEKNRLEFWEAFKERAEKNKTFTSVISSLQKPQPQNWYNISIGSSTYYICLVASTQKKIVNAGIYINNDREVYEKFQENEQELADILGTSNIEWKETQKTFRFIVNKEVDVNNRNNWDSACDWLCDQCVKIKNAVDQIMA